MLARAVTAMTSNAENFNFTVSTPSLRGLKLTFLAAESTSSKPLEAPFKSKLFFSLSSVDILVETFRSN